MTFLGNGTMRTLDAMPLFWRSLLSPSPRRVPIWQRLLTQ